MRTPSRHHLAWLAPLLAGCTLLFDLNADQCATAADCASFGSGFECSVGVCRPSGGSAGAQASGGSASITGGAGDGGESSGECQTHADCLASRGEAEPLACVKGTCVPLLSDACPVVLPRSVGSSDVYGLLKRSNAAVLGAFAYISPAELDGISVRNYDLVLRDFAEKSNGITLRGERRDVIMVVCSSNVEESSSILDAGRHLAYDLDVPGILAALPADETQLLFETFRSERGKNVFLLMPNYTDETLINLEDDSLIWHMLSGARALSVAYPSLVTAVETHLRNLAVLPDASDLRVAVVTATDERFSNDLGEAIISGIVFNAKTAEENAPDAFLQQGTTSYTSDVDHVFDHGPEVERLLDFAPHLVIGATGEELLDRILPLLEGKWSQRVGSQSRPFYLFPPFLYNSSYLSRLDEHPGVRSRMIGVNWPAAEADALYQAYLDRYELLFGRRDAGYENFYDAAYYLVYALAAGRSGDALSTAAGFKRLLAGTSYHVGQADMLPILNALSRPTGDIKLLGAMGAPTWDVITGGRKDAGSAWCVDGNGAIRADVLRYQVPAEAEMDGFLTGNLPCFEFPAP